MARPSASPETLALLQRLGPEELKMMVTSLSRGDFVNEFAETLLLLVRLEEPAAELEAGLVTHEHHPGRALTNLNVLAFRTIMGDASELLNANRASGTASTSDVAEIRRRLSQARQFGVALKKRSQDETYASRITVGRARNKDVVLRHSSVSKFHAWFEYNQQDVLCVADANSSNGTLKNGAPVLARKLVEVRPGDLLRFGSVETLLCDADSLWRAACL